MGKIGVNMVFFTLIIISVFFKLYPHLAVIPRWCVEEEYIIKQTYDALTSQQATVPMLTQNIVNKIGGFLGIDRIAILFNPIISSLTTLPLFLLFRRSMKPEDALIPATFYLFSEAVFYRTALYSTTEPLAMFLAVTAIYYITEPKWNEKLLGLTCLIISFTSHMLPGTYATATLLLYYFLKTNRRNKVILTATGILFILFLISPLNPHQRLSTLINIPRILQAFKIENLLIYTPQELLSGALMYLGTLILTAFTLTYFTLKGIKNNQIHASMLIIALLLFVFSYIFYMPQLFAPPRLIMYFIPPLAYYATKLLEDKDQQTKAVLTIFICSTMILSAANGVDRFLLLPASLTLNEYNALNDLYRNGLIKNTTEWWSDYPTSIKISTYLTNLINISPIDENQSIQQFLKTLTFQNAAEPNGNVDTNHTYPYKYVYLSKRISINGYFLQYTKGRTQQIYKQVKDIWRNASNWKIIYDNYGVKVYERS